MDVRNALALVGLAGLVAIPVAAAAQSGTAIVASANGGVHWIIPLPNPFGVEVVNQPLAFNARKYADGSVSGQFEYHQLVLGEAFDFNVDVTCINIYDGNRAKIGGVVTQSSDPTEPPGVFAWFQVFDNGEGANAPPDRSSLVGSVTKLPTRPSATVPTCLALDLGTSRETSRSASESLHRREDARFRASSRVPGPEPQQVLGS
jgi:hypothetical protein